jgi:hypothetical protein
MADGVTFDLDALDRVAEANRRVPDVLRGKMTAAAQNIVVPAFTQEIHKGGGSKVQRALLIPGASAVAGFAGWTLLAGMGQVHLSGGGTAATLARPFEFGTNNRTPATVVRRTKHGKRAYRRVTTAQLPRRSRSGWVVYPAGGRIMKRAVPLYVQVCVKVLADAMEGTS